jgi:parallel beta-helix repeat protein
MYSKKTVFIILIPAVMLFLASAAFLPAVSAAATPHDPIEINGNAGFTSANGVVSGAGSSSAPYIIEGWSIINDTISCISISNTDAYFIIRYCELNCSATSGCAISLNNVTNGRIEGNVISNNTITGAGYGIFLYSSTNNTISFNTVTGVTDSGIYLDSSTNNTVANNTLTGCAHGIYLDSSNNNTVANNTLTGGNSGIELSSSTSNTVANNTVTGAYDGIYISSSSSSNTISSNTITGCTTYGIELSSSTSNTVANNTVTGGTSGIYLSSSSSSNTISFNTITGCTLGIELYSSTSSNIVSNNTITSSTTYGIDLYSSSSNTVANNTLTGCTYGIFLYSSTNNTVANNTITGGGYGTYLSSSTNNTVSFNTVTGVTDSGIFFYSSTNNTISFNTVTGGTSGIYLHSSTSNTVANNTITNSTPCGILLAHSSVSDTIISGNALTGATTGIMFDCETFNVTNISLLDNDVSLCLDGICLSASSLVNVTISGNNVTSYSNRGIYLDSAIVSGLSVSNNTLTSDSQWGIKVEAGDGDGFELSGNSVSGGIYDAVYINFQGLLNNSCFSGNTITVGGCGLNLNAGVLSNASVSLNSVLGNLGYGIYAYASAIINSSFTANLVNASSNTALQISCADGSGLTVADNVLSNSTAGDGLYVYSSNYNLSAAITGNEFSFNYEGAYLEGLYNFTLSGNTALNNSDYGIMISYCKNGTMQGNTISGSLYNFGIDGWELSDFIHDIDASNTVEGRSVRYLVNLSNTVVPADAGYIGIVNCTNVNATDQDVSRNYEGLLIAYSNGTTAEDVRLRLNYYGAYILFSSGTVIADSTLSDDEYGAASYRSSTAYSGDTISNCYYGIDGRASSDVIANSNITGCNTAAYRSYEEWHDYNFTAYGNTLRDNTNGFTVPIPQNANITHNYIYNTTNQAIYTAYCPALITGNLIDGAGTGIYLYCCEGAIVHGNTIANATTGINQNAESQDNSFIGNSISNVGTGIIIGGYHWHNQNYNTTLAFNTVTSFTSFGFEVYYVDGGDISNNTATGAAAGTGICLKIHNYARNVVVSGNAFSAAQTGIYAVIVPNLTVSSNNISACDTGILLERSDNGTTCGNTIAGCGYGIGIIYDSEYQTISNNTITGSSLAGICSLYEMYGTNDYLNISFNTLLDNYDGISLTGIMHSVIHNNTVANGTNYGIALYSAYPCSNVTVYYNELLNNTINAFDDTTAVNLWDYNFYSDYTGPDRNCDRIGDIPYNIAGGSNQDMHPLVRDTLPPYFIFFSPANGSLVPESGTIYVTYADATSSIVTPLCQLILNGMDVSASASFGQNAMAYDYGMPTGTVDVSIYIEDCCGYSAWLNWSFEVDAQAPSVDIISPAGGSCVNSASPVIAASYSDGGAGIDLSRVRVYVDGADVSASASIAASSLSYTPAALAEGEHTALVVVFDNAGNSANVSWTFCVDTAPPALVAFTPPRGTMTASTEIPVSFTVWDANSGVDASSAVMTVDGSPVAFATAGGQSAGYTLSYTAALADGEHTVAVTVRDLLGNEATYSTSITVETGKPAISGLIPSGGSLVATGTPTVSASFSDPNGIDASSVTVVVNGIDVTAGAAISESGFSWTGSLPDGVRSVQVSVSDTLGNEASASWAFTIDTAAPEVTGVAPANGAAMNNSRPAISASFSDATSGINAASARLLINGTDVTALATVTASGISYTPSAALPDGAATVVIRVSDNAGNEATATSTWTVDTKAPPAPTSPLANGSTVSAGPFQFNASFSGVGPLPGSVHLLIDGVDVTSNATVTPTGITYSGTLPAGSHTITLVVTDAAGNPTSASWTVNASASGGAGADMTYVYAGIVVVVVIVGGAAVYFATRKKQ